MTVDRFALVVVGEPVPSARAGRNGHRSFLPARNAEYRSRIQAAWMMSGRPSIGDRRFALSASFYRSSPRAVDLDNLVKALLDALNGLAWVDDARLVCLSGVHKLSCAKGDDLTRLSVWVAQQHG